MLYATMKSLHARATHPKTIAPTNQKQQRPGRVLFAHCGALPRERAD
jgi:hypothetical protein